MICEHDISARASTCVLCAAKMLSDQQVRALRAESRLRKLTEIATTVLDSWGRCHSMIKPMAILGSVLADNALATPSVGTEQESRQGDCPGCCGDEPTCNLKDCKDCCYCKRPLGLVTSDARDACTEVRQCNAREHKDGCPRTNDAQAADAKSVLLRATQLGDPSLSGDQVYVQIGDDRRRAAFTWVPVQTVVPCLDNDPTEPHGRCSHCGRGE